MEYGERGESNQVNYNPIKLTLIVCKVLEHTALDRTINTSR